MLSGRTYDPDEAHTENPDGTCIKGYGVRIGNEEIKEKDIKGFDQNLQKNSTFLKIERCCFSLSVSYTHLSVTWGSLHFNQ